MRTVCLALSISFAAAPSAATESMRETFAMFLAAAAEAEKGCEMPGQVEKAKAWVAQFNSGFDTLKHIEDLKLTVVAGAYIQAKVDEIGQHAWCVEYRALMAQNGL